MSLQRNYPETVAEVLDESMTFRPAALRAVRAFGRSKPWRGNFVSRWKKFKQFNHDLGAAYEVEPPLLVWAGEVKEDGDSGSSYYDPMLDRIVLSGRLSVVTFLHEWAHRLYGLDERRACSWSINLFRKCFPRSWAKCRFQGHMVRRQDTVGMG